MAKLSVFIFMSLDGYYKGLNEDISWHKQNAADEEFAASNLAANNVLIFGRRTYEMMASFWPTPMAIQQMPKVAEGMNRADKVVFSRTLNMVDWEGTTLIKDDLNSSIRRLKAESDRDLTILGSGELTTQLAAAGLIDRFDFMIDPLAIGNGTSVFKGLNDILELRLLSSKALDNGALSLTYQPA